MCQAILHIVILLSFTIIKIFIREVLFVLEVWKIILIAAAVGVAFGVVGFILGGLHRKRVAEAAIGSATKEANRIVSEAMTQAEAKKKEAILEAKDEIHKQRSENEKELQRVYEAIS